MTQIIDLGKLRFSFAGEWLNTTTYESNDVVKYGGNVYVYTYALKTSAILPTDTAYWALMVEGFKFKGVFSTTTAYRIGDGVAHGGKVYVAIQDGTAQTPPNATFWSQFADGIQYEGAYSGTAQYQRNDVVVYGGGVYIAKQDTTGNLPSAAAFWDKFVDGISPKGVYNAATAYASGDIAAYGPNLYRALGDTTGNLPTDTSKWTVHVTGTAFQGNYSSATTYFLNDLASYGANLYRAKGTVANTLPSVTASWELVLSGFVFLGAWSSGLAYKPNEVVQYGGSLYKARADVVAGVVPTVTASWERLVPGLRNQGVWSTATAYNPDDIVVFGGNSFVVLTAHASTVFATDLAAVRLQKFNSGIRWRGIWTASTDYLPDDIVTNGVSTFIAKSAFTSGAASPAADGVDPAVNAKWTLLALGAGPLGGIVTGTVETLTGLSIAGGATINLNTSTGNRVQITGSGWICSAVILARGPRVVVFTGVGTMVHHATAHNLNADGLNITTAVNDICEYFTIDGVTYGRYTKANGLPNQSPSFATQFKFS